MNSIDKVLHELYSNLDEINWKKIPNVPKFSIAENYEYYYAENRLYIFKHKNYKAIFYLGRGNNPIDAFNNAITLKEIETEVEEGYGDGFPKDNEFWNSRITGNPDFCNG